MKRNKHKPPSRIRYEENNPVWSVRMPKEWIEELEAELEVNGQSRRDFLGIALEKQSLNAEKIRVAWRKKGESQGYEDGLKKGKDKGYNEGMNEWAIWVQCFKCYKQLFIIRDSPDHKYIIEMVQGDLKHSQCPEG
jgi:flagellar biosynthesis/type III secretory pathway protein FliH